MIATNVNNNQQNVNKHSNLEVQIGASENSQNLDKKPLQAGVKIQEQANTQSADNQIQQKNELQGDKVNNVSNGQIKTTNSNDNQSSSNNNVLNNNSSNLNKKNIDTSNNVQQQSTTNNLQKSTSNNAQQQNTNNNSQQKATQTSQINKNTNNQQNNNWEENNNGKTQLIYDTQNNIDYLQKHQLNNNQQINSQSDSNYSQKSVNNFSEKTNDNQRQARYAQFMNFGASEVPNRSLGIDISDYQNDDIIYTLHNDGAKFVIVKVSEGMSNGGATSAGSKINIAKSLGMEVQGYHFAHFGGDVNQARQEGIHAVANAKYYGVPLGSYLACDYEVDASGSVSANTQAIEAFMDEVKQGGYIPLLYSGAYYLKSHVDYNQIVQRYGSCLWVASYPTTSPVTAPDFNYFPSMNGVIMWQYSDNYHGVDGDVCVLPLTYGGGSAVSTPSSGNVSTPSNTGNESTWTDNLGVVWHNEKGTFTTNTAINLRWGATPESSLICTLPAGSQIDYDAWANSGGYIWLRQPRSNGDGYLVAGLADGSQKYGTFSNGTEAWGTPHTNNDSNYTGEKEVDGHWQYWQNGTPIKNTYKWLSGENKEVYYDRNGNMVYGQQQIWGHWQYFTPGTGAQVKNSYVWLADDNKEVYYDGNGNMVYGQQNINGHWQYFDPQTGAQVKNNFVTFSDKTCYYDGNGNMVYGSQYVWGAWRYFDPVTGAEAKNTFITNNGCTCYYGEDGSRQYGLQNIQGSTYYFDNNGNEVSNSWETVNGNKYYFGSDGKAVKGIQYIGNNTYDFDDNGVMQTGWKYYDNAWHNFDYNTGAMKVGLCNVDGHLEYFNPYNGAQTKGDWKTINGKTYYFEPKNGYSLSGFQTIDGYSYLFSSDGVLQTGEHWVNGDWKYFDPQRNGIMVTNTEENIYDAYTGRTNTTYFDNNGNMVRSNWHGINGKEYYFDPDGNMAKNGVYRLVDSNGNTDFYYYDANGQQQFESGFQTFNGHKYYFNSQSGTAYHDCFINIEGKTYYCDNKGQIATGAYTVKGNNLNFDNNGVLQSGSIPSGVPFYMFG